MNVIESDELNAFCHDAGLEVTSCQLSAVEKRSPNFAVITLVARKP